MGPAFQGEECRFAADFNITWLPLICKCCERKQSKVVCWRSGGVWLGTASNTVSGQPSKDEPR